MCSRHPDLVFCQINRLILYIWNLNHIRNSWMYFFTVNFYDWYVYYIFFNALVSFRLKLIIVNILRLLKLTYFINWYTNFQSPKSNWLSINFWSIFGDSFLGANLNFLFMMILQAVLLKIILKKKVNLYLQSICI